MCFSIVYRLCHGLARLPKAGSTRSDFSFLEESSGHQQRKHIEFERRYLDLQGLVCRPRSCEIASRPIKAIEISLHWNVDMTAPGTKIRSFVALSKFFFNNNGLHMMLFEDKPVQTVIEVRRSVPAFLQKHEQKDTAGCCSSPAMSVAVK